MKINYKWALVLIMFIIRNEILTYIILTVLAVMFLAKFLIKIGEEI